MKNIFILFFVCVLAACDCVITCKNTNTGMVIGGGFGPCFCSSYGEEWVDASHTEWQEYLKKMEEKSQEEKPDDGRQYVLAEYSYGYRNGAGWQFGDEFTAYQDWIFDASGRKYWTALLSREECEGYLEQVLYYENGIYNRFKNDKDAIDSKTGNCNNGYTCYDIKGNVVKGNGYRTEYNEFHCIPKEFWDTLKPEAEEKCYENTLDYDRKEVECDERHLNLDKEMHKSVKAFSDVVKKCADYKEDKLFVCDDVPGL